jgi:2-keto-3-deoxy-L-rhamnonate aldolase RhmA
MALDVNVAKGWIEAGSQFTAIGVDLVMLAQIAQQLRSEF